MSVNYKLIGKRMKEVRNMKGMSQADLAVKSKTSAQYLSQIENGKKKVSLQVLVTIAEILEVTLDELLAGNQVNSMREYNEELNRLLTDCTPYEKRILYEVVLFLKQILRDNHELLLKEIERI